MAMADSPSSDSNIIPEPPSTLPFPVHSYPQGANIGMMIGVFILGLIFSAWPVLLRLNNSTSNGQNSDTDIEMGSMNILDRRRHPRGPAAPTGGEYDVSERWIEEKLAAVAPTFVYGGDQDGMVKCRSDECAICWEDFGDGDICRVLPACNHVFHKTCVGLWVMEKRVCPLCRVSVQI